MLLTSIPHVHKNVFINHHLFSPPQRPRQCGPVCFGSGRCRWCSSADPLHAAPILLLWKRPHHPKGLRSTETSTAARCCGCQQKPGRPRRPPLHAGYGELTHYNTPLLCNHKWKCITTNCFHAIAKIKAPPQHSEFLFHFLQFPYDLALILSCKSFLQTDFIFRLLHEFNFTFASCAESPGWPLQATRGRDLLPGEPTPWPVGAWTGPAGTLKGLAPHTQTKTGA